MIITLPQNRSAGVSENVTFQCIATGYRRPNITWVRQDGMEFAGSQVILNTTTAASNLTITNVMSNNFTNYSCIAENIVADNIIETITKSDFANFTLYKAGECVCVCVCVCLPVCLSVCVHSYACVHVCPL